MYIALPMLIFCFQNVKAVIVEIEQGTLRGEKLQTITGNTVYSFKGVRYAAPPLGKLRFQAPESAAPWIGIRNATQHGDICLQKEFFSGNSIKGSEDCLFLNIYSPNLTPKNLLSVAFFIHGGGYIFGSGNDDHFGPDFFINQNVLVVTINYRLGAFGFMSLESKDIPGNAGMKDQVAALKWVKRNIKRFGGDPNMITIMGYGAGGASCTLHSVSPLSKGLFRRAIPMSGVVLVDDAFDFEPRRRAIALAKILGFESENLTALFEFFQTVPANKFLNTRPNVIIEEEYMASGSFFSKMFYFAPIVEENFGQERFLIEKPVTSIANRRINDVDLMITHESKEGLLGVPNYESIRISQYNRYPELLVPRWILYLRDAVTVLELSDSIKKYYFGRLPISIETMREVVQYFTDTYIFQILRYTRIISTARRSKTFLLRFSGVTERNIYGKDGRKYGITGSAHFDMLMYLFQANKFDIPIATNSTSYRIIVLLTTTFANFIKYGNPTPDASLGAVWNPYNSKTQNFMDISSVLTPGTQPETRLMRFWKSIYDRANIPFYDVQ